jgi:hypothetical protein
MLRVQLRVAPSQSKHKLYIGNIPRELSKEAFKAQLDAVVRGAAFFAHPPTCLQSLALVPLFFVSLLVLFVDSGGCHAHCLHSHALHCPMHLVGLTVHVCDGPHRIAGWVLQLVRG